MVEVIFIFYPRTKDLELKVEKLEDVDSKHG